MVYTKPNVTGKELECLQLQGLYPGQGVMMEVMTVVHDVLRTKQDTVLFCGGWSMHRFFTSIDPALALYDEANVCAIGDFDVLSQRPVEDLVDVARALQRQVPAPQALAATPWEDLAGLGILPSRARTLVALGAGWPDIEPETAAGTAPQVLIERLCAMPGIGPWTAHYVAMRALGWTDAALPGDAALVQALQRLRGIVGHANAQAHARRWRPWRSYAALRLWHTLQPVAR